MELLEKQAMRELRRRKEASATTRMKQYAVMRAKQEEEEGRLEATMERKQKLMSEALENLLGEKFAGDQGLG